jgi:small-conductance mechanosensitive channel
MRAARQLALAALLLAGPAGAVQAAPALAAPSPSPAATSPPPPAAAPSPSAVPVDQVFRAADELDATLRRAESAAQADSAVEPIEARLAAAEPGIVLLRGDVQPQQLAEASARELDRLRRELARADLVLADAQATLEKRSAALASAARELEDRAASWRLTDVAARSDQAPAPVLRRIAQMEDRLAAAAALVRERQDRVLALQGKVSDLRDELSDAAAAVDTADAALTRQLFETESAPLWRALTRPGPTRGLGTELRQGVREARRDVADFLAQERVPLAIHLAGVGALALALLALRRPVTAMGAADPTLRSAAAVLSRPISAALLLSVPLIGTIYPPLTPTLVDLFWLAFLAPLLRLLAALLPSVFLRPLHGLVALFALEKLSALAPPRQLLARVALLVVTAGALAGLARGLRRRDGWVRHLPGGGWGLAARAGAAAALALLGISVVANVAGNTSLAELLTGAVLGSATLAVVLLGIVSALGGALAALLQVSAVRRRALVARHHELLLRRADLVLQATAVAFWGWRTAGDLGVADAAVAAGSAVLALRLTVGGLDVSLGNVAAFAVTLALAVGVARAIRFLLDEGVFSEVALPRGVPTAISTTVQYALLLLGFSWAVLAAGMEMSRFSFLVGALGVGVGFGLQNVVNNLVSGLILLYERPVQVGDVVEVGTVSGEVTRIGVRSSTVRTFAGAEVIVPNASLIAGEVTNWTLSDRRRRVEVTVGVAFGSSPQQVIELLLAAVRGRAGVLDAPAPVALLAQLGESALQFTLRFWTADFDRWTVLASEVTIEVYASLGRAGIEIPYPQRDVHLRGLAPSGASPSGGLPPAR